MAVLKAQEGLPVHFDTDTLRMEQIVRRPNTVMARVWEKFHMPVSSGFLYNYDDDDNNNNNNNNNVNCN